MVKSEIGRSMAKKDTRDVKVMEALRRGEDPQQVARRFRVSPHIVVWMQRQVAAERKGTL